jgi:RES domain-containing protein
MFIWRVSNYSTLDGAGGLFTGGRWHNRGRSVVYCAENPATALLETLIHLEVDEEELPAHYIALKVRVPDTLPIEVVKSADLPENWQRLPWITRSIGDSWLQADTCPVLSAPSALVPQTRNFLINPLHPDSARIEIVERIDHPLDPRFAL